jgi:hypothetical protein
MKNIIFISLLCLIISACSKHENANTIAINSGKDENAINSKIASIDACPCWIGVPEDDLATRERILDIYTSFQNYDNATIRSVLVKIELAGEPTPEASRLKENRRVKIFGLLRMLFNIPSGYVPFLVSDTAGRLVHGNWGTPFHEPPNGTANLLWPFEIKKGGGLVLTGVGYDNMLGTGPSYNPVLEFDEIMKKYKYRNVK